MMRKRILACLALTVVVTICSCKKDKQPDPHDNHPVELWNNVVIIDTNKMVLNIPVSNLPAGTYVFTITDSIPSIQTGDVIVGYTGEGYIRKVTTVTQGTGTVTYQTTAGTMEDVFKSGSFNFTSDMNDMYPMRVAAFTQSLTDYNIYNNGPLSVDIVSAHLSIDPRWNFDFDFDNTGLQYFEMSTAGSSWQSDVEVKVTAAQAVSLLNERDTLAAYEKRYVKWVTAGAFPVPVVVTFNIFWLAEYSLDAEAAITNTINASGTGNLELGMKYDNHQWQGLYNFTPVTTIDADNTNGNATLTLNYAWRPVISAKLYGVAGPHASVALMSNAIGTIGFTPYLDWDLKANAWLQATAGADVTILGRTLASFPDEVWETSKLSYQTPDTIQLISGNNQTGAENQALAQPCKVRVLDSNGDPVAGVPVYFTVVDGGGSVNPASAISNQNGDAQTSWTLGSEQSIQHIKAASKYGNHSDIQNSPVEFTATAQIDPLIGTWNCTTWNLPNGQNGFNYIIAGNTVNCPYPNGVLAVNEDTTVNHTSLKFTFTNNGSCQYYRTGSFYWQTLVPSGNLCTIGITTAEPIYPNGFVQSYSYLHPTSTVLTINGINYSVQWVNSTTIILQGELPDRKLLPTGTHTLTFVKQ